MMKQEAYFKGEVMISMELLSEVLGVDCVVLHEKNGIQHYLVSEFTNEIYGYQQQEKEINIYELVHKCKEWAYNLQNEPMQVQTYRTPTSFVCEVYSREHPIRLYKTNSDEEPEAIFAACQWILEKKVK